jgi:uncharacterized protein (TIGR00251 family)
MKLAIKVVPGASRDAVVGWLGDTLKVCVHVPPEKGKANKAVEVIISKALGLSKNCARIIKGHTSARKVIEIDGLSETEVKARLTSAEGGE